MSRSADRVRRLGAVYGLLLLGLGAHLAVVMGAQHEQWLERSYRNRWAFKDVPSVRGALRDRFGRVLAEDAPTFEVGCVYERFRLLHPVGAAVHGATLATRLFGDEVRYSYFGSALGPMAAARLVLSLPVGTLLWPSLQKEERRELQSAAVTMLCAASDRPRGRVRRELLAAAADDPERLLGEALSDLDSERLLRGFASVHARLLFLDQELQRAAGAAAMDEAGARSLLSQLDQFRIDSLDERRTARRLPDGEIQHGELFDRLLRPVARDVPFATAAALGVAADDQPGLRLEPALRRIAEDLPPTLAQMLGSVQSLEQSPGPGGYLDARLEEAMANGLDELVPDDLLALPEYRRELAAEAQRSYVRALRSSERRGAGGMEAALDDELRGAPGMRLVERDARAREQVLWSSFRVAPGADVALSIDLDLQRVMDRTTAEAARHWQAMALERGVDPERIDVALALVDARTGQALALAGAPSELDGKPRLPAVLSWRGNGSLGSIVKPLFLVEQLAAARSGMPAADLQALQPCERTYRGRDGRVYRCDHAHWQDGQDPVEAISKSCNTFFFQVAEALGDDGLRRGLARFGLLAPPPGELDLADDGRWQARPEELPTALCAAPRWVAERQWTPMRGIGYSLAANPLSIARAYAALATGHLPRLSLLQTAEPVLLPLGVTEDELALVQQGLAECVQSGTARSIAGLAELSVHGKTGTAEIRIGGHDRNNAWFAGFLPTASADGVQLAFCAVVYAVPDKVHGADAAGLLVASALGAIQRDPPLARRYLPVDSARGRR